MEKKYEVIDKIIEYGIYLYIILMFLTKGEGIRNILIFGNFGIWLLTLKHRKNLYLLKEPVSVLFWLFLGVTFFSVIFSIDRVYSLLELKGEPLKSALLFPVISTVFVNEERLKKMVNVIFLALIFIVSIGYYSYFFHNISVMKPDIAIMHTGFTGYNRFAVFLNSLLPFAFIFLLLPKKTIVKVFLGLLLLISVIALILTSSRMGLISFFCIVFLWSLYFSKTRNYSFIKIMSVFTTAILITVTILWFSFPDVRNRVRPTSEQLRTFNLRTQAWEPAIHAILQRPIFGWGYGKRIFFQDVPFQNTQYKKAPAIYPKNLHNTFIKILFHQGIIGLIPYLFLILFSIKYLWKRAFRHKGIRSFVLIASVSVLFGNYIVHSMTEEVPNLLYLSFILGLGVAVNSIDENSNN